MHQKTNPSAEGFPQDVLSASAKTRLELCWARAPAPAGPANPLSPDVPSRVDLTPGYPIWLFRLFAPCPTEFPAAPGDLLDFYIRRAMDVIWNPGSTTPRYDTTHGASSYNMNILGGSFNLDCWIKELYPGCNCYDLAGIAQLACTILVDDSGNELVDSRFVFQDPNGYVNPGPLFGWVAFGGDHLRCNTPFWKSRRMDSDPRRFQISLPLTQCSFSKTLDRMSSPRAKNDRPLSIMHGSRLPDQVYVACLMLHMHRKAIRFRMLARSTGLLTSPKQSIPQGPRSTRVLG